MIRNCIPDSGLTFAANGRRWLVIMAAAIIFFYLPALAVADVPRQSEKSDGNSVTAKDEKKTNYPTPLKPENYDITLSIKTDDIPAKHIYLGSVGEGIINPRCANTSLLLESMPEAIAAKKIKKEEQPGKWWILQSQGSDRMIREIRTYATTAKITFVCERDSLLALLRQQDQFKLKSDEDLLDAFDITAKIIKYFEKASEEK